MNGTPSHCDDLAVPVSERDHIQGSSDAPVLLVEYGDYECPYCLNAWPIVRDLTHRMGNRLAVVFRHFPQSSVHPRASVAAQAAEAAAAQGKFWEMHDLLFANQQRLESLDFTHLALQLGLEVYRFQADMEGDAHQRRVREDFVGAARSGVKGTPAFFLNGCRYTGAADVASFLAAIEGVIGPH